MTDAKSLAEFVREHGQTEAGRLLGVTQGAIWQMLEKGRRVYVREVIPGRYEAEEIKPIGHAKHA